MSTITHPPPPRPAPPPRPPAPPPPPAAAVLPEDFRIDGQNSEEPMIIQQVASVFEEVLQLPSGSVTASDNFFELGGHSLAASRFVAKLGKVANFTLPVSQFLKSPTPTEVAYALLGKSSGGASTSSKMRDWAEETNQYYKPSDMDLQLRAFWRYIVFTQQSSKIRRH